MNLHCFIFTWRGHEAAARRLEQVLSPLVRTSVINSEEHLTARYPHWIHVGEEAYFSAQWRRAVELFDGDLLFHIQADAAFDDFERLFDRAVRLVRQHDLGVYEPNVDFTDIRYERARL